MLIAKYDLDEMLEFLLNWTKDVQDLLNEKGFTVSEDDLIEKISLLHTEAAELTDAFKKGKGQDEEGGEIADILIRLLNIPCLFPSMINSISSLHLTDNKPQVTYKIKHIKDKRSITDNSKYTITYYLHEEITNLGIACDKYKDSGKSDDLSVIKHMVNITLLTKLYCELFLGNEDIHVLVDRKMRKNWDRPFRYNTDPELFK